MMYARQGDAAIPMVYASDDAAASPMMYARQGDSAASPMVYARDDAAASPMMYARQGDDASPMVYARKEEEPKMYYDQQSSIYARKEDEPANAMYANRVGEVAADQQHSARLIAIQMTTTTIQIVTTTKTSTKTSLCASLLNVTGACRRRRRGVDKPIVLSFDEEDKIDLYKPSEVQQIEPTPLAQLNAPYMSYDNLESSASDPVELDIIGLQGDCVLPRRFPLINGVLGVFNITLRYTTTLTATLTTTTTITNGSKPFFVSGCTPSPFLYSTC